MQRDVLLVNTHTKKNVKKDLRARQPNDMTQWT